ncbi:hypothetical protein DOTSEDRAFT_21105 [Dothistroma septosporum NZE10]|uniref:PLD phosphodiesterase domain-containing protein n=1 Tax=Dothistroma septosporum (strain NZE10 / CBS 128990) TaxID=675120 RepID=N1PVB8_DOTSN|nr:hypothetical protein DOTSEDRAFT_21105 [Dothistroma septosporum NZE10]
MPIPGFEDRKAMEHERLARIAAAKKRERSISPPPSRSPRKAPKLEESTVEMESGAKLRVFSEEVERHQQSRKGDTANAANERMKTMLSTSSAAAAAAVMSITDKTADSLPQGAIKYPHGVVKKTWAFGHERDGRDIKLEEVLEPSSVRTAVLSAFQWDTEWVLSKLKTPLNGGSTKCVFVMQAKTPDERAQYREWASGFEACLRICLPPMDGAIYCMHSKLMLLFHPHKLRVAIPSANLLNFDWGETGQMENSVFMIDLPRLAGSTSQTTEDLTFFGQELMFFIERQGLDKDLRKGVLGFDFSATEHMAFIHTVGGMNYERTGADRTGLLGLSRAVRYLGLTTDQRELEIDFAASSIGQLNDSQVQDLHSAASGQDLIAQAAEAKSKAATNFFAKKAASSKAASTSERDIKQKLRVYFPTKETVQASTAGAAGTICLQRKYFEGKTFPRAIFRDYKSTRKGLLSHNKILCARSKSLAWLYIGSANMSKSAWGEIPKDRKERRITCRNWECGVLLPVPKEILPPACKEKARRRHTDDEEDSETDSEDEEPQLVDMSVFSSLVDLPFEVPGDDYNGREPWYFTEKH